MTAAPPRGGRLHRPDLRLEKRLLRGGCARLGAMDEVGRGALAGPVTVGVVVVTPSIGRVPLGLRDSKLLTPAAREALVGPLRRWAIDWAIGHAWPSEIDAYGIMAGLRLAARRALGQLAAPVDAVLLDGNHDYLTGPQGTAADLDAVSLPVSPPAFSPAPLPVYLQVKADLRCAGVAAASVLAKTTRDAMMVDLARHLPQYGWAVNKGYATASHLAAIAEHGPSERHRRSWRLSGPTVGDPVGEDGGRSDPGSGKVRDGRRER